MIDWVDQYSLTPHASHRELPETFFSEMFISFLTTCEISPAYQLPRDDRSHNKCRVSAAAVDSHAPVASAFQQTTAFFCRRSTPCVLEICTRIMKWPVVSVFYPVLRMMVLEATAEVLEATAEVH